MNTLEFSRITNGLYVISSHNDERLHLIGQILLNDAIRGGVKKALEYAPDFGMERKKDIETTELKVQISPLTLEKVAIKFINKSAPERVLETDMTIQTLTNLIEDFEDARSQEPETITLTRVQDTFNLE